jgi:hypothetical protein
VANELLGLRLFAYPQGLPALVLSLQLNVDACVRETVLSNRDLAQQQISVAEVRFNVPPDHDSLTRLQEVRDSIDEALLIPLES